TAGDPPDRGERRMHQRRRPGLQTEPAKIVRECLDRARRLGPYDHCRLAHGAGHYPGVRMRTDEYVLDSPVVRDFVSAARVSIDGAASPEDACAAIRPHFAELLTDPDWLPVAYRESAPESRMGGGIGQWLLFRAADRSLSLFSLVVPSGSETPVHDHLAWGLVGLYQGRQDEEIYDERNGGLQLLESRSLASGDFYELIPPRDDIH